MRSRRSKRTMTMTFIAILFFWNIFLTINLFERSDDQLREQMNNYNARLFNLESHSGKVDKNIANLFRNDSLVVIREPKYQETQDKHGFLSFLYKMF